MASQVLFVGYSVREELCIDVSRDVDYYDICFGLCTIVDIKHSS